MCCTVSIGHFFRLDIALHLADTVQDCSYFPFMNNEEKIKQYCKIMPLVLIKITRQELP